MVIAVSDLKPKNKCRISKANEKKLKRVIGHPTCNESSYEAIIYFLGLPIAITILAALIFSKKFSPIFNIPGPSICNQNNNGTYLKVCQISLFFIVAFILISWHTKWQKGVTICKH